MTILIKFGSPIGKTAVAQAATFGFRAPVMAGSGYASGPRIGRLSRNQDVDIIRKSDAISPALNGHLAQGTTFELITIEFYGPRKILFLTYTLESASISAIVYTSYSEQTENISLFAATVTAEYFRNSNIP